jgi:biopolymer transport protein ExbD
MRYAARQGAPIAKGDMTPMIDMTFQLIAFFMVVVNFTEAEQNELIHLPSSELAKPPDEPLPSPITLQLTSDGMVIMHADEYPLARLRGALLREKQVIDANPKRSSREATIIIRADREAKTGKVQELIKVCQDTGFEKFALRAKEQTTVRVGQQGRT